MSIDLQPSQDIKKARDQLDDAIWHSLEELIKKWTKVNELTLDLGKLNEALEKLSNGGVW